MPDVRGQPIEPFSPEEVADLLQSRKRGLFIPLSLHIGIIDRLLATFAEPRSYLTPEVVAEVEANSPPWPPLDVRRVRTPEGLIIVIGPIAEEPK